MKSCAIRSSGVKELNTESTQSNSNCKNSGWLSLGNLNEVLIKTISETSIKNSNLTGYKVTHHPI